MPPRRGPDAMRGLRSLLRHPSAQAVLCWLVVKYIQLVWKTGRWTFAGDDGPRALNNAGTPYIIAFWHGRLLMAPYALAGELRNVCVLISTHRDGRIISRAVHQFDITTIDGSSSRGGADALRRAAQFLRRAAESTVDNSIEALEHVINVL